MPIMDMWRCFSSLWFWVTEDCLETEIISCCNKAEGCFMIRQWREEKLVSESQLKVSWFQVRAQEGSSLYRTVHTSWKHTCVSNLIEFACAPLRTQLAKLILIHRLQQHCIHNTTPLVYRDSRRFVLNYCFTDRFQERPLSWAQFEKEGYIDMYLCM